MHVSNEDWTCCQSFRIVYNEKYERISPLVLKVGCFY